jgi:hypothetical protein
MTTAIGFFTGHILQSAVDAILRRQRFARGLIVESIHDQPY